MKLRQFQVDKFLAEFKLKCDRFKVGLNITCNHYLGSHYFMGRITIDRSQVERYIESSNGDPLQVWQVVCYHELGHSLGHTTEESCWDWLERQPNLDQATVTALRSQVTWGNLTGAKGRNWHRVRGALNSEPIQEFIKMCQLSSATKELIGIQTPGKTWHWIKTKYLQSSNLEEIINPLLPNSRGYLMELCYSQKYDCVETEVAGLLLWREIETLL